MSGNTITLGDLTFKELFDTEYIEKRIDNIANQLNNKYKNEVSPIHTICVLNGAIFFFVELIKRLKFPIIIDTIQVSSYIGTESSTLSIIKDCSFPIKKNEKIILIEDIIDTGKTIDELIEKFSIKTNNIKICSLLFKENKYRIYHKNSIDTNILIGEKIGDEFVVGYGMDYNELGRNLDKIYVKE